MIKSFQLGGKTFKIKKVTHDNTNLGIAKSPLCEIQIQTMWDGKKVPSQSMDQTLIHEVVHCILDEIGMFDLNKDETFVQSFSSLLYQFIQTKE